MIIDPHPMNVIEWTDRMALPLSKFGVIARLDNPADWRDWANNVQLLVGLNSGNLNPYTYDDWLPWAVRFSETVESLLQ